MRPQRVGVAASCPLPGDGLLTHCVARLAGKALREVAELFESRPLDVLQGAAAHWAYVYERLVLDNDRRVREAAHSTLRVLASRLRKQLQKTMPALAGPLWRCGVG